MNRSTRASSYTRFSSGPRSSSRPRSGRGPLLAAAALLATISLAGCTGVPATSGGPGATSSASTRPGPARLDKVEGACTDGMAIITRNNAQVTIPGDCPEVEVSATNTLVTVGTVEILTVTGSISKIQAAKVAKIVFRGDGNIVVAPGEAAIDDRGSDNKHIAG